MIKINIFYYENIICVKPKSLWDALAYQYINSSELKSCFDALCRLRYQLIHCYHTHYRRKPSWKLMRCSAGYIRTEGDFRFASLDRPYFPSKVAWSTRRRWPYVSAFDMEWNEPWPHQSRNSQHPTVYSANECTTLQEHWRIICVSIVDLPYKQFVARPL
jgi:hypothetical protein